MTEDEKRKIDDAVICEQVVSEAARAMVRRMSEAREVGARGIMNIDIEVAAEKLLKNLAEGDFIDAMCYAAVLHALMDAVGEQKMADVMFRSIGAFYAENVRARDE